MEAIAFAVRELIRTAGECAHPTRCGPCGLLADRGICPTCRSEFQPAVPAFEWFSPALPLSYRAALYRYDGRVAMAVRALKYLPNPFLFEPMAEDMAEALQNLPLPHFDVVVPVPIHPFRRIERGFNQSDVLCSRMDAEVRADLLRRVRRTRPQAGLDIEGRRKNVRGAFAADPSVEGLEVLLVDDVTTSGFTAIECARALRRNGAKSVGVLAYATGGNSIDGDPIGWHDEP